MLKFTYPTLFQGWVWIHAVRFHCHYKGSPLSTFFIYEFKNISKAIHLNLELHRDLNVPRICRWQTFIGAALLLLCGRFGWVEMSRISRYLSYYIGVITLKCFHWLPISTLIMKSFVWYVVGQVSGSFLAPWLRPLCGKHICRLQGLIAYSTSHNLYTFKLVYLQCSALTVSNSLVFFLFLQDIPVFFTLQNSSHVVSYVLLKVVKREVSTACSLYANIHTHTYTHTCIQQRQMNCFMTLNEPLLLY